MKLKPTLVIIGLAILVAVLVIASFYIFRLTKRNTGTDDSREIIGNTLYKSTDGGESWKRLDKFPGGDIAKIILSSDGFLLIATKNRGVWKGTPDGLSFEQYSVSLGDSSRVFDILEPASSRSFISLVFFRNRGRAIKFENNERSELIFTPLENYAFLGGFISRAQGKIRLINSDGGLYESFDNGQTWSVISRFQNGSKFLEVNKNNHNQIWIITTNGSLYRSETGGFTWKNVSTSLSKYPRSSDAAFIHFDAASQTLYHGSAFGLLASFDFGESFEEINILPPPTSVKITAFGIDPSSSQKLLVGAGNQLYLTKDGGFSWKLETLEGNGGMSHILINPRSPREIFVGFDSSK